MRNFLHQTSPEKNTSIPPDVVLKAVNLKKVFRGRPTPAVDNVSFQVRTGQIVSLLGPNGAGKTTSFRMACGMINGEEGQIFLNGVDVTRWPMHRRVREGRLGYLPQDRSSFNQLTAEQNLYAAMQFLGYSRAEQKAECSRLLAEFNLEHIRKSVVGAGGKGGVSGGELRRLEVARAMLTRPKILLLDEPFAAVDPITVTNFKKLILKLSQEGMAILITDHSVADALPFCDYSYIVKAGRILYEGTPNDIVNNQDAVTQYLGERADDVRHKLQRQREDRLDDRDDATSARRERPVNDVTNALRAPEQTNARVSSARPTLTRLSARRENAPRHDATTRNVRGYQAPNLERSSASRVDLTLSRDPDAPLKQTPTPRDNPRQENRFAKKIPRLLKKRER